MWFNTEEKNEEDNQDIQTLINKTVKETLAQYQQGNLNTYSSSSEGTRDRIKTKWVSARGVSEIKGLSENHSRELMNKGYFGQVKGKGKSDDPRKVLREVVENTELTGKKGRPSVSRPFPSDTRDYSSSGRPKVNKKPKTNYLSKWIISREVSEIYGKNSEQWARSRMIKGYFGKTKGKGTRKSPLKVLREVVENTELTKQGQLKEKDTKWVTAKEVAEMKGTSLSWAIKLMDRGHFGKTTGKGKSNSPTKVLREAVENTELIGRGFHMKDSGLRDINFNKNKKYETFKPTVNPLAYEDIKNELMEDKGFLMAVSREVMRNLKFVTKLDNEE